MSSSRREFLKTLLGAPALLSLSTAMPRFLLRSARAMENAPGQTALVVLQLSGGNDGLNTVVPYADDAYGRSRTTLRLKERELHKIDDHVGFHSTMQDALELYRQGTLSILHGVGYPNSNRNHDDALRDWHTAQPGVAASQTGWLGRTMDLAGDSDKMRTLGTCVAPIPRPLALNAEKMAVPSIHASQELVIAQRGTTDVFRQPLAPLLQQPRAGVKPSLDDFVSQTTAAAYAASDRVEKVLREADGAVDYPAFGLARQLKTIVELVRAELGIRIYFAELGGGGIGGFDNHANQRDNHAALLREISVSLAAFVRDLQHRGLADRVVLMTFSEFGRTLRENGRRGTDHGAAQPLLIVGGGLRGGQIGKHPSLTDLDGDSPKFHTDFRRVYATLLDHWLGCDSTSVLGEKYQPVEFLS